MKSLIHSLALSAAAASLLSAQAPKSRSTMAALRQADDSVSVAEEKRDSVSASRITSPGSKSDYRIGAGDVLEINVWKEPDASVSSATVRSDGKISVPFTKEVEAAGLTPLALEATLTSLLSEYFRNPQITVMVKESNSQRVYVIGEVKKEGAIRLQSAMTVLQALAEAGGITDYAKKTKIQIFRVEDGKQRVYRFDYSAVVRGQRLEQNFQVLPGDTIVVPR